MMLPSISLLENTSCSTRKPVSAAKNDSVLISMDAVVGFE